MIINKKLEGLNFSWISSFWKRLVFFVHVYYYFCFATTAVTLHWANKRVHYSKGLGVLAEVLAIWVFIDSASLPLASKKFPGRVSHLKMLSLLGCWRDMAPGPEKSALGERQHTCNNIMIIFCGTLTNVPHNKSQQQYHLRTIHFQTLKHVSPYVYAHTNIKSSVIPVISGPRRVSSLSCIFFFCPSENPFLSWTLFFHPSR